MHLSKKRRGAATLLETVISVALFSMILVMLLTLMSHINTWNAKAIEATDRERDTDFMLQMIVADVKSAEDISISETGMQLVKGTDAVLYYVSPTGKDKGTLYRNDEFVINGITEYSFIPGSGETVSVYIVFKSGQRASFMVRR